MNPSQGRVMSIHADCGVEKVIDNVHISIAKGDLFSVSMINISFTGPVNIDMIEKAIQVALSGHTEKQALLHRVFFSDPLPKSWIASGIPSLSCSFLAFFKQQGAAINLVPVVSIGGYPLSIYSLWV
jgi:hypothetical protein